jgi:hypothetical protein
VGAAVAAVGVAVSSTSAGELQAANKSKNRPMISQVKKAWLLANLKPASREKEARLFIV